MYAYEKLMNENGLKLHQLPEDAQIGIKGIKQLENAIKMTEKRGQSVSEDVMKKLRANDKWVATEIIAFLDDEDPGTEIPFEADEVIEEMQNKEPELTENQKLGLAIEKELLGILGQHSNMELSADDLKSEAPRTYKVIFETYEEGGENGLKTSKVSLMETDELVFTLAKQ